MKAPEYYRKREQTYLKHFFLERYLETVAFHIGYAYQEFAYVDCFSGPWQSGDEELADTSIRIALDKLNYVRDGLVTRTSGPSSSKKTRPRFAPSAPPSNNTATPSRPPHCLERLKTTSRPSSGTSGTRSRST